ncbi:hypothetical protein KQ304_06410 [Synechococcus sp. CS-1329]|jgi:hypothetical protein|uniref:hypothetical protein n=1 Tax=Synechococcus sp. CS-1329 TaxID=2847975 RepID=UPI00223AD4FF|nr:hypothetical protein [Synechococcus sp. CS-1329]MCT0218635.1 hypothetical protein [Synechococcus sp. CS-1329]
MALPRVLPVPSRGAEAGFLLPLSFGVSLVLLLSALSVQTMALQGSRLAAAELEQRRLDDALASAAEQVAARLSGSHACLLPLASELWESAAGGCAPGLSAAPVLSGQVDAAAWRLVSWTPGVPGAAARPGELRLELSQGKVQRLFALDVAGAAPWPLRVVGLRGIGR